MSRQRLHGEKFTFPKGEVESSPIYTKGGKPVYVAFPVNPDGTITLDSTQLTVEGSFDGSNWFTVNDFTGVPVKITVKAAQGVIPAPSSLATSPAILPVRDGLFVEAVQMVRFRGNRPETELRICQLYIDRADL